MTLTGRNFSAEALYECNEGYELVGDRSRRCEASGEWSGTEPTCVRKSLHAVARKIIIMLLWLENKEAMHAAL